MGAYDGDGQEPLDLGLKPIDVSIDAIDDLIKYLTDELTLNLQPKSTEIIYDHKTGTAVVGPAGSSVLMAVKGEYENVSQAAITSLGSYVDATRTLIGAVTLVADLYRNADSMVNARTSEVLKAFDDSWVKIQSDDKARADALDAQRRAAMLRKLDSIDRQTGGV